MFLICHILIRVLADLALTGFSGKIVFFHNSLQPLPRCKRPSKLSTQCECTVTPIGWWFFVLARERWQTFENSWGKKSIFNEHPVVHTHKYTHTRTYTRDKHFAGWRCARRGDAIQSKRAQTYPAPFYTFNLCAFHARCVVAMIGIIIILRSKLRQTWAEFLGEKSVRWHGKKWEALLRYVE